MSQLFYYRYNIGTTFWRCASYHSKEKQLTPFSSNLY